MAVIATEGKRYSDVVAYEHASDVGHCRDMVVCNEAGAATYVIGTVLGRITASGKYRRSVQNAADGSQTPAAIVINDGIVLAAGVDKSVRVLRFGPAGVKKAGLVFDASWDQPAELAAAYAALEAVPGVIRALDAA